nr:glycoside hydrolase family 5 protein [uncultured Flavobacterium sp.]
MKKQIITAAVLLLSAMNFAQVKEHGQLHVEGTQLTDSHGKAISLRGMSYGWSSFWPRFYNAKTVQWLKDDWNVNVVRAAAGIEVGDKGKTYKDNPAFVKKCITNVVDGAIKSNIYVIIDWHSHNVNLEEAKAFFDEMSKKYAKYPNIIYEVFNEPDEETWPEVKAYSEAVIKVIRKNDPNNVILVGCPHWDQDINLPAADPIKGYSNLMYTVHFYAATHKQYLRDRTDAAIKSGLPVFISECAGMEATGDGPLDYAEWQAWIDWMEARKLSWVTWSVSDKDETCSVLYPTASSDGKWKTSDLKESGKKAREYLKKLNK